MSCELLQLVFNKKSFRTLVKKRAISRRSSLVEQVRFTACTTKTRANGSATRPIPITRAPKPLSHCLFCLEKGSPNYDSSPS